jgi:seryl-tRNA synthetase
VIDIKALERPEYAEQYRQVLKNRKDDPSLVDKVLELNKERKKLLTEAENRKAEQNRFGPIIAQKKKAGENADTELAEMQKLAALVKELEAKAAEADARVTDALLYLPNMTHSSVPVGSSDADNKVIHTWGEKKNFSFKPLEHGDLGEKLGIIDFDRGAKVTGARFTFLKGAAAQLERALMNFMLDLHTREHKYMEMMVPYMVNHDSFQGTGNFPKFKEDVFHITGFNYALIPTAEVPVTNYYREEVLNEDQLPTSFVAFSPCFRSEAGSYGKDTKGLIRQHQFHKVELMIFSHPENSYEQHERLTSNAEEVLKRLELPFQRVALCTGDIGFGSAKTYDLNVWLPGQNAYREISSCSNFEDFQARRSNIRFKPKGGGKPQFAHTLNGSGLAIGRTLIALMENYQHEDGSIKVPDVLVPYMGGLKLIK